MGSHANFRRPVALCACILLVASCSGDDPVFRPDRSVTTIRPDGPTRAPERMQRGCVVPPRAAPPDVMPRYEMSIRVDPGAGVVSGTSRVTFQADRATRRLVFRLWPNGPRLTDAGAQLVVEEAKLVGARGTVEEPDPTTLVIDLGRRLGPYDPVTARLRWRLELPGPILDRISQNGDAIRLGSFFPILSWEGERGWATDPPTSTLAESSTSPTAIFEVKVDVPAPLDVIATGREKAAGEWIAENVRDFAVAVGRFDEVFTTVETRPPVNVRVGVADGVDADPREFARAIETALQDLSRRYGPYPWPAFSMAIVPDLGRSGIEYPAMVFQGEDSLENVTTHEVAHSWFYGLVGNNQARDPWLDEGVTSWAQARGDGTLGFFRDYELPDPAAGRMGRPMQYWDGFPSDYYAGVYVQGAKALDALGDAARVDCALRRYVAENAYEVATTADLLRALEPVFPRAERVLERFGARP